KYCKKTKLLLHPVQPKFQSKPQFEWSCADIRQFLHLSKVEKDRILHELPSIRAFRLQPVLFLFFPMRQWRYLLLYKECIQLVYSYSFYYFNFELSLNLDCKVTN